MKLSTRWPKTRNPRVGLLERTERLPQPIVAAAERIWESIRNAPSGSQLTRETWEAAIAAEIMSVVEPFVELADSRLADRRQAVENLNAACLIVSRMRSHLRAIGAARNGVSFLQREKATELGKVEFSSLRMPLDEPVAAELDGESDGEDCEDDGEEM